MNLKQQLLVAVPTALFILGNGTAIAGETVDVAGAIACVNDKWTELELYKGHSWPIFPAMRPHPRRSRRTEWSASCGAIASRPWP